MNDMSMETIQAVPEARAVVVFGRDNSRKPHASVFDEAHAELAEKAAGLMGMHVLRLETAEARELAAKLPHGRIFASGRAFVPFVKAALFASLAAIAQVDPHQGQPEPDPASAAPTGPDEPEESNAASPAEEQPRTAPDPLAVGTVVIAPEGPKLGWWEAVVVKAQGDLITLRWRDYPKYRQFALSRDQILHLPPGAEAG